MGFGMQEIGPACIEINSFASVQRTGAQKALIGGILKVFFHGSPLDLEKPLFSPFQNREFSARRRQAPSAGFHSRNLLNNCCPAICLNRLSLFLRRGGCNGNVIAKVTWQCSATLVLVKPVASNKKGQKQDKLELTS